MNKYYTIYQITDLISGKIYIGKHETNDLNDSYMGSGKLLIRAQKKHGLENFKKEIIFIFDNEIDMNAKEAKLVTEDFCLREDTYNICPGGKGGWGFVNSNNLNFGGPKGASKGANSLNQKRHSNLQFDLNFREKIRKTKLASPHKSSFSHEVSKIGAIAAQSEEAKIKRKLTREKKKFQQKENNSQYGKKRIKNLQKLEHASVHPHMIEYWLSQGWILGKLPNGIGRYVPLSEMIENTHH